MKSFVQMDGTVDKEKFKAAVFRRGQKQELLHSSSGGGGTHEQDGSTLPDHVTGDEKIEELFNLWSLPRSGFVIVHVWFTWIPCTACDVTCIHTNHLTRNIHHIFVGKILLQPSGDLRNAQLMSCFKRDDCFLILGVFGVVTCI